MQAPPPDGLDLRDFPTASHDGPLYRAHSRDRGAWFFSSSGGGRFDLRPPSGTCYLAESVASSVRERVGEQFTPDRAIAPEDAAKLVVSKLEVTVKQVADLNAPRVGEYPITSELTAMDDYRVPHAWARALSEVGMAGVRYRGRFSYSSGDAWAIFGGRGPDESRAADPTPMDGFDACALAGVAVLPAPPSDLIGLTIVKF